MNSASLNFLSKVQDLSVEPTEITGSYDGLNSFLNIFVSCKFRLPTRDNLPFDVISLDGQLKVQNPGIQLSHIIVPVSFSIRQEEQKCGAWFYFNLTDRQIHAIEKNRKGDASFILEIKVVALLESDFHFNDNRMIRSLQGAIEDRASIHFNVPRSIWVEKILKDMKYQSFKLIEVPLTHKTLKEAYDDIIFEFNKAEEYFNQPDYNKCVAHCRNTLDALTRNLKKIKTGIQSESSFKWLENIDEMTLKWIDELNKANSAIASKSHHAGQRHDFTRKETESIYLVILGLLNFIGEQKR